MCHSKCICHAFKGVAPFNGLAVGATIGYGRGSFGTYLGAVPVGFVFAGVRPGQNRRQSVTPYDEASELVHYPDVATPFVGQRGHVHRTLQPGYIVVDPTQSGSRGHYFKLIFVAEEEIRLAFARPLIVPERLGTLSHARFELHTIGLNWYI